MASPIDRPLSRELRGEMLTKNADLVRQLRRRVIGDVIEIGRLLSECKALLGHGNWLPWLNDEFSWSCGDQTHGRCGTGTYFMTPWTPCRLWQGRRQQESWPRFQMNISPRRWSVSNRQRTS
jgi:hypothetical protein